MQKALNLRAGALALRCLEAASIEAQDLNTLNKLAGLALLDADQASAANVLARLRQLEAHVLLRSGVTAAVDPVPIAGALRVGGAFRRDAGAALLTWSGLRLNALASAPLEDSSLLTAVSPSSPLACWCILLSD